VSGVVVSPLGFPGVAAEVVAADGPLAGRSTTTDDGGCFALAGVQSSSGVTLRVTGRDISKAERAAVPASQPASTCAS
jgi:hypothetical protein